MDSVNNNIQLEIGSPGRFVLDERLFLHNASNEGYNVFKFDLKIKNKDAFLSAAKKCFQCIDTSNHDNVYVLMRDDAQLRLKHGKDLIAAFKDQAGLIWFLNYFSDFLEQYSPNKVNVFYYYLSEGDTTNRFIELDIDAMPKVLPELYPDINVKSLTEDFQSADESILLLYGAPGVGKTTFLKYMLSLGKYREVAYIKDMSVMKKSDFWSGIAASKYDLLIFDDLDFAVGPRVEGDSGFVTNLLSYSDGIFNDSSKIVITTNQAIERIDEALIRPGRCFDFLVLKSLSFEEAFTVWTTVFQFEAELFTKYFTPQKDITQAALMSTYKNIIAKRRERRYMKKSHGTLQESLDDAGVSVHHKVGFNV